jgi:hypothetical protein
LEQKTSIGAASGAPDTIRCPGRGPTNWPLSDFSQSRSSIIHRTIWCTPDMSDVPPDCPVPQEDKGLQRSTAPNPNGQLTWHAPNNEQCHVRCTTRLSSVPSTETTKIVVGAINTPNHHHSSHPSFQTSTFNTRAKPTLQDTIKRSNPLQASKSTQLLSDLREGV